MVKLVSHDAMDLINLLKAYGRVLPTPLIIFDRFGIYISDTDENLDINGEIYLSSSYFEEYNVEGEKDIKLNLEFLKDVSVHSEDKVEIELKNLQIYFKIIGNSTAREYNQKIKSIGPIKDIISRAPVIRYENYIVADYDVIANSIRSFRGVSETLKIIFEKDRVILEGDGNGDDLRIELTSRFGGVRGISYGEECTTAIYVLKHLLDALNVFESSKTPTLALFVKDTYPLKLEGMFKNRFNRVRFYLQPLFVD